MDRQITGKGSLMTAYFKRGAGAAAILISTAQLAWAGVTAQDVWADWKTYMTGLGYAVTGSESASGDTLTISGLTMSIDLPEDEGSVSFSLSSLVFSGQADGTVAVTIPGSVPVHISGQEDGEKFDVVVDVTQSGHSMIVSGDPGDITYKYKASQAGVTLASLMVDGQAASSDMARAAMTMTNIASTSQVQTGDVRNYTQHMSMDSLSYDVNFKDPESDGNAMIQGSVVGLSFQGSGAIPPNMNSGDFRAMLNAGFAVDGLFNYDSGNSSFQVVGSGEDFSMKSSSQGGKLGVMVNGAKIAYDIGQKGLSLDVTTNQLPFPIAMEMAELGIGIDVPVAQSDQDQDFTFLVRLLDFTMADMLWGLFDPGAVLPRDPVTVILDLNGKAKILADIVNPEVAASLDGPPGELRALTIEQLLVSGVGSKLSGTGDFTFDNSDLTSFPGFPAPTGVANLEIVGANGLMDKLIRMGLMAESDAAVPRMMMGMLTVAGEGDDTLTSKIEFGPTGQISANGQRIK